MGKKHVSMIINDNPKETGEDGKASVFLYAGAPFLLCRFEREEDRKIKLPGLAFAASVGEVWNWPRHFPTFFFFLYSFSPF